MTTAAAKRTSAHQRLSDVTVQTAKRSNGYGARKVDLIGLGPGEVQHVVLVALEDAHRLLGESKHLVRDDEVLGERVPAAALPLIGRLI
jgi:hypothetical protein